MITTGMLEMRDIDAVLGLLRVSLGEPPGLRRTPELFAWKHIDNPFGRSIALVAESDGQIAGLRTLMRWDLITSAGETVHCARAVDTATHPDFQRRGIFRRLTEEAIEEARSAGVDLIFNTPNQKSGAGYLSMGWKDVGRIGVMIRPSRRLFWPSAKDNQLDWSTSIVAEPTPISLASIKDRSSLGLRTPRTPGYLTWRFSSHPTARYLQVDLDGSIAIVRPNTRKGRDELLIADLFGTRPTAPIKKLARISKTSYLAASFARGSPERAACLRAGMMPMPGLATLTLMARPLNELGIDVSSMSSWDLAISDLELL